MVGYFYTDNYKKYKNAPAAPSAPQSGNAHAGRKCPKNMGIKATAAPIRELIRTIAATRFFAPDRKHSSRAAAAPRDKSIRYSMAVRIKKFMAEKAE